MPDEVWAACEPVLPPVVWQGNGRPPKSNRECLHAALFVLDSGTPWKQMPPGFPCGKTVRGRVKRWLAPGAFRQVWASCAEAYRWTRGINFDQMSIDGAQVGQKGRAGHRTQPDGPRPLRLRPG